MFLLYRHILDGYNVYHIYMNVDRQINRHREAYSPTEKYEYLPILVVCSGKNYYLLAYESIIYRLAK